MTLYAGIDLHSNNSVVVVQDEEDHVVGRRRLANDLSEVCAWLEPYRDDLAGVVVESTYNWYWLVDGLMEQGYTVHLANTVAIQQYNGLKYRDDASDARWLAKLLRLGELPEGYIYPRTERAIRDLLRKRSQLVRQATMNLLSIQNLFARNRGEGINADRVKQLTPEAVDATFEDGHVALAKALDARDVGIDARDVDAELREARTGDETDVARPHDADSHDRLPISERYHSTWRLMPSSIPTRTSLGAP